MADKVPPEYRALRNRRYILYSPDAVRKAGRLQPAETFGTDMAIRPGTPPPVAEYDAWVARPSNQRPYQHCRNREQTGARIRRIVIMRRSGATWRECGEAVGVSGSTAKVWVEMLPPRLGV
jgi:hypothetical protein